VLPCSFSLAMVPISVVRIPTLRDPVLLKKDALSEVTCSLHGFMRNNCMISSRLCLQISLVLLLSCAAVAQEKSDAATVRSLELKWTESYKQRSIDILSSLLADEFTITVEDGSVYSKAGYISHTADSKVKVEVAEMTDLKVRIHGDVAVVTGAYHEHGESEGKPYDYRDRLTDVWIKAGGKWQVIASHYSVPVKP
jgi:ketosteroid isomerase-like protein